MFINVDWAGGYSPLPNTKYYSKSHCVFLHSHQLNIISDVSASKIKVILYVSALLADKMNNLKFQPIIIFV